MAKSFEDLKKEIERIKMIAELQSNQYMNQLNEMKNEIVNFKKRTNENLARLHSEVDKAQKESYQKEVESKVAPIDYADILKKIITKYYPVYYIVVKQFPKFDVLSHWSLGGTSIAPIDNLTLSIPIPESNNEFAGAIMNAILEFKNKIKPEAEFICDDRLMSLKINYLRLG